MARRLTYNHKLVPCPPIPEKGLEAEELNRVKFSVKYVGNLDTWLRDAIIGITINIKIPSHGSNLRGHKILNILSILKHQ